MPRRKLAKGLAKTGQERTERALRDAVRTGVAAGDRLLVAVSGGRDSMVLLDALMRWRRSAVVAVATFDHGTGPAARDAADLVAAAASAYGVPLARARAHNLPATEAAWRAARWSFLRETASLLGARVATGHTSDDQIETVFIRALRDAGPRGLAALYAHGDVRRPLLHVSRGVVAEYAELRGLPVAEDPSNTSRAFLRNRVRLDLLPALEAAHPGFCAALLDLSARAATWRAGVERYVDALGATRQGRSLFIPADAFAALDATAHDVIWPAAAARAGVMLDRRGTARLAAFSSTSGKPDAAGRVQLAGGHEVIRHARAFEIRPAGIDAASTRAWTQEPQA